MMQTKRAPDDIAESLKIPEEMAAYLEDCTEEADRDAALIAKALGEIARAKGMTKSAREAVLSRAHLYTVLSEERSPSFETLLRVISALGPKLSASANDVAEAA